MYISDRGSNNCVGGKIPQKLINMEALIRHVVGKIFSKRIGNPPCLLDTSEYMYNVHKVGLNGISNGLKNKVS